MATRPWRSVVLICTACLCLSTILDVLPQVDYQRNNEAMWMPNRMEAPTTANDKGKERQAEKLDLTRSQTTRARRRPAVPSPTTTTATANETMTPWKNATTTSFYWDVLTSGFRNQVMAFTIFVMYVVQEQQADQILIQSLNWQDTNGSNQPIPLAQLFDVAHWNSFHPLLPRLVECDPLIHTEFNCYTHQWKDANEVLTPYNLTDYTKPYRMDIPGYLLINQYMRYTRGTLRWLHDKRIPHAIDKLVLQGALRPSTPLRHLMERKLQKTANGQITNDNPKPTHESIPSLEYFSLHARVEPDMQRHRVCRDKKVVYLKDIVDALERTFPTPPAKTLVIAINRPLLEKEGTIDKTVQVPPRFQPRNEIEFVENILDPQPPKTNWVAVENLRTLNQMRTHGLWNGTVSVVEFGAQALLGTAYERWSSTVGSWVDFSVAQTSTVFIGTEVSTFSHQIMSSRCYAENHKNYKYTPAGIEKWTTEETKKVDPFWC